MQTSVRNKSSPATMSPQSDEDNWRSQVIQKLTEQESTDAAAKIFYVPRVLFVTRPDAYLPQHFALGPYHYRRNEVKDMERYKLAGAKRFAEKSIAKAGYSITDLVDKIEKEAHKIRPFYQRGVDLKSDTLAWMMAMDTCFLLDFLEGHNCDTSKGTDSATKWIDATIRDAMKLQNQIPLILFSHALALCPPNAGQDAGQVAAPSSRALVLSSPNAGQVAALPSPESWQVANDKLGTVLERFIKDVSPIEIENNLKAAKGVFHNITGHAHMLELLYHYLVPEAKLSDDGDGQPLGPVRDTLHDASQSQADNDEKDERFMSKAVDYLLNFIRDKAPPPLAKLLPPPSNHDNKADADLEMGKRTKSPWADEITIPSVVQLARLGVRFEPTKEGIADITFDPATATLRLPIVKLNGNTEVLLRNLVAYEAVALRGPLVLARYTELMNGIIDTRKDVKILRLSGVVVNNLKTDQEAADMWNGLCRATRLSKVSGLDETIEMVNEYSKKAAPRAQKLLKKYVFESWRILSLLAAIVMLLMTAMQTFCSAYPCTKWFGVLKVLQVGGTQ